MASSRRKARIRAVEVLYEAEARDTSVAEVLERRRQQPEPPINEFTRRLAAHIDENRDRVDAVIAEYAVGWTLERMPIVDRNVLRMGVYELLWDDDIPDGVAVAEAVAVVRELSSNEAPTFVNGLLSRILEQKSSLAN
ncbi:transcription antitermination factor NusB [Lipingzhangella sp. LS1_29]|uniref:Transcription antitermination protein NusB n=1 Tax=Lipingzhangella rawalii TaxID=2055835 RepID=A0ABU2H285_9ACTN|nr:transcription antitermination factor NusB [Lipingzhangella rawalii]MDS1269414.1 transcription antitermination factor NusB [Lipingzhangella rawalii]